MLMRQLNRVVGRRGAPTQAGARLAAVHNPSNRASQRSHLELGAIGIAAATTTGAIAYHDEHRQGSDVPSEACAAVPAAAIVFAREITDEQISHAVIIDVQNYMQVSPKQKGYLVLNAEDLVLNAGDVVDVARYGRLASSNREVVSGHLADL